MNKVHAIITDRILEAIEKTQSLPWQKPWNGSEDVPRNHAGKPYRGINTFILHFAKMAGGYRSNYWVTPNQARKMGGSVRKGEHVQYITFWNVGEKKEVTDDEGNVSIKRAFLLRYYKVVNIEQCEGLTLTKKMKADLAPKAANTNNVIDEAEAILATYLAMDGAPSFTEGGNRAYYQPLQDSITIPERGSYISDEEYYSTAFHEVGHSTGHSTRCNREGINNFDHFGSDKYGAEELVAEMTAVMLCGQAGIDNAIMDNSVAYLQNWVRAIKADPTLLVTAAGRAQKAADFVLGTTFDADE